MMLKLHRSSMQDLSIKKESKNEVQIFHPVSILNICLRCLFNEMATHFDDILSKYQFQFRK